MAVATMRLQSDRREEEPRPDIGGEHDAEVQGIDLELHGRGQERGNEHDHGGQPVEDGMGPVVTLWMSALSSWGTHWLERSHANSARRSRP
jgi:hypothetical protein